MMGSGAFESPLVSHARMRALYRTLIEVRELSRVAKKTGWVKGLEACWLGTALDLREGDVVSAPYSEWLVQHTTRARMRQGGPAGQAEMKKALRQIQNEAKGESLSEAERLMLAVGQAMVMKRLGAGVVMAYALAGTASAREWRRVMEIAGKAELPLVIVAMAAATDLGRAAKLAGGVPVIPVDAGDTLALYRVAQESVGRARAGGGIAVIECVAMKTDAVRMMSTQLVKKGICTERWVKAVEPGVRRALAEAGGLH